MRLTVTPSAARKRLDDLCTGLNSQDNTITFTRKTEKGEQSITRRKKTVSDGAQATGKALIQLYASRLKTLSGLMPENLTDGTPPSLPTNNVKLAGYRQNVTDRTIRTHIQQLKAIGFISAYKFHGHKNNFELWLNPQIIFGPDFVVSSTPVPAFSAPDSTVLFPGRSADTSLGNQKNFPHKQAIETYGNSNTSISNAENQDLYGKPQMATTQSGPETCHNDTLKPINGNKEGGGRPAAAAGGIVDNFVRNRWENTEASPTFNSLHIYYYRAVRNFWSYASRSLWPDRKWSMEEYSKSAELLTNGIFLPFIRRKPNNHQFDAFTEELHKAVDIARKYYENHPEYYPGEPYTGQYGKGYFDIENPRGFKVAIDWRFKNKAANDEAYGHRIIKTALRHLQNHASGKIPKSLQGKTYLQLFEFYNIKMQRFEPELRETFFRRVAALKGLDQDLKFRVQIGQLKQSIKTSQK